MNLLMVFLFVSLGGLMVFFCYKKTGRWLNFGTLFSGLWAVVGSLSNCGFFDLVLPALLVNICMLVGIGVFGGVYFLLANKENNSIEEIKQISVCVDFRIMKWINIAIFFLQLPFFFKAMDIIKKWGFTYLRVIADTAPELTGRSNVFTLMLHQIFYPFVLASILLCLLSFILQKKGFWSTFVLALVNLILYQTMMAARNGYVTVVFMVAACIAVYGKNIYKNVSVVVKKKKRGLYLVVIFLIVMLLYITGKRSLGGASLIKTIYVYCFAGPSYLTQLLDNFQEYEINKVLLWGSGTFGFVYNLIAYFFTYILGIDMFNSAYLLFSVLTNVTLPISPVTSVNAMSTVYFVYLMDWGYMGIVIGPMLMAIASVLISRKIKAKRNIRWHAIGIYWMFIIYRTIFKCDYVAISFLFFFIAVFIFTREKKVVVKMYKA